MRSDGDGCWLMLAAVLVIVSWVIYVVTLAGCVALLEWLGR